MRHAFEPHEAALAPGLFEDRRALNRRYLLSLSVENLVQNHRLEAGVGRSGILRGDQPAGDDRHWGWETPGSPMRGHFVGHWLSAAAREVAITGDAELRARVDAVVEALEECQAENGDGWVFGISPRLFERLAAGRPTWAPQYVAHKTLMGLVDTARDLGHERALAIAVAAAGWIDRWSSGIPEEVFQDILDTETGGMLEVWAELLALTGDVMFARLLRRYRHSHLFDPLLAGADVLTNQHANTTIPEVLGAARAYEVTGDEEWRSIVVAYWRQAVTDRGTFCTGGQTSGEIWTPPFEFAARRGEKNQEHCTVYNMMRLADVLFRWTGHAEYLDYIEANAYNGILAQQHPRTGMVSYFLPLHGGAQKNWGSATEHFWCCHGTLVQAHTRHSADIYYRADAEITVAQYRPSSLRTTVDGVDFAIDLRLADQTTVVGPDANSGPAGHRHRVNEWHVALHVRASEPMRATLRLRVPAWATACSVTVDGVATRAEPVDGFVEMRRTWNASVVELHLPFDVRTVPIPDEPQTVAFTCGPVVLAGLCEAEVALDVRGGDAAALLRPDNERQWAEWLRGWRIGGQPRTIRLVPLHEVTDQAYSVYFPTR
ncbi:beta-L-arabinofuranosidase domain-containing protein [Gryllotalpicola koreensis]|uniref:Glycoside hydrolase family 127 protein n=1 Tax=Gryllotalpicola koreensis TaxID=993086 RepID=A0ABP8ACJ6_9MICO